VLRHIESGYYYTLAGMAFLIFLQAWWLLLLVNRTNTDLERFLSSVHDKDSSIRFSSAGSASFGKLHDSMNQLNSDIQRIKIEKERKDQVLHSLVDQVEIGILSLDSNGNIEFSNKAAARFLSLPTGGQPLAKNGNCEMYPILQTIRPGQEILHKVEIDTQVRSILIRAAEIRFEGTSLKLISFQDITHELNRKELDSWQKLIRVLTHEIMNSISPITSLTSVISGYFKNREDVPVQPEQISVKIISKTLSGLDTIEETGKGLLNFVDKYRSLTSLPKPDFCRFTVDSLIRKCRILMEANIPDHITISTLVTPPDIVLTADMGQVELILINLIKNAIEALSGYQTGKIQVKAFYDDSEVVIQVEDDGAGITGDKIDDIFVPFYTTKEHGSGIGLSLSRQIMENHGGSITVHSTPHMGATFSLKFNMCIVAEV
jgi:nitrogen fixation/metabolism regulation signal transduction histidine kinase